MSAPARDPASLDLARTPGPTGTAYLRLVLVLGTAIALGPFTMDMYLPALPAVARDLGAEDAAVQATLTGMVLGLGLGQLVVGPLSDAVGRRRPIIAGLVAHGVASALCAVAPDVQTLIAVRVLQGIAGAAVSVVAMASVRDLFSGRAAARVLSRLLLLMGIAPLVAPSIGGLVLGATSWRGIFLILSGAAAVLAAAVWLGLAETLPPERRRSARPRETARTYRALLSDKVFVALAVVGGMTSATLLAYVSGTPFLLQEGYGMGVQGFALVFGVNAVGSLVGTQGNPLVLRRFEPREVLTVAIAVCLAAACAMTAAAATGVGGRLGVLVPLAVILCVIGFALPNTPALALTRHGGSAGTAAAVYGAAQFGLGGCAAPLVGMLGGAPGVAMAGIMSAALATALTLLLTVVRRDAGRVATAG